MHIAENSRYTDENKAIFLFGLMQGYETCLKKAMLIQVQHTLSKSMCLEHPDYEEYIKEEVIKNINKEIVKMIEWEETESSFPTKITFTGRILAIPNNKKKYEQSIFYK